MTLWQGARALMNVRSGSKGNNRCPSSQASQEDSTRSDDDTADNRRDFYNVLDEYNGPY